MQEWASWIWIAHCVSTFYMTGLIWFVQRVHYPLMNRVAPADYVAFQQAHMIRTTWVVGPAMLIEAFSAVALLYLDDLPIQPSVAWINMALLLGIWVSTAAWQVPCHHRLSRAFDAATHRSLVYGNWIRTALWSIRALLLAVHMGIQ